MAPGVIRIFPTEAPPQSPAALANNVAPASQPVPTARAADAQLPRDQQAEAPGDPSAQPLRAQPAQIPGDQTAQAARGQPDPSAQPLHAQHAQEPGDQAVQAARDETVQVSRDEVVQAQRYRPGAAAADRSPGLPDQIRARREPGTRRRHIAVIAGTARAGRLVAKLLADELDRDERDATVSDAGSVVGAPAWTTAVGTADQLVLAVDAVGTGPAEAANLIDRPAPTDRGQIRQAITIVLLPPARRGLSRGHEDIGAIREHFQRRTRAVVFVPHDPKPTAASQVGWGRIVAELERGA